MAQVHRNGGQNDARALILEGVDNVLKITPVMTIDRRQSGIVMADALVGEHLHALPLELLPVIPRIHRRGGIDQELADA